MYNFIIKRIQFIYNNFKKSRQIKVQNHTGDLLNFSVYTGCIIQSPLATWEGVDTL